MLEKNRAVLAFMALAVLVSGCADSSEEETSKTAPLEINSFSASPNPVTANRVTRFNIELQNTGDADATDVAVRLFGPTFATGSNQLKTWRDGEGGAMDQPGQRTHYFDTLRAPSENNPSIPKNRRIGLTAPAYEESRVVTDRFYMKLFYQYETTASSDLTLMTEERRLDTGTTRTQPTIENSAGPIQMDIQGQVPKIQYGDGSDYKGEICITVRNDGEGTPFLADDSTGDGNWPVDGAAVDGARRYHLDDQNTGKVELVLEDVGNIEFAAKSQGGNPVRNDAGSANNQEKALITMVDGEGYQCYEWGVEGGGKLPQEEQTVNLQMTAEYGYTKETSTSVTTEGRRGAAE